jgi:hypothetical protein
MKSTKIFMRFIPVAVLLTSSGAFAVKVTTTKDFDLNISVLLQARAVASWDGDQPAKATNSSAPNGSVDTDFYMRRMRLIVSGAAYQHWVYYLMLDEPNFGSRGNYNIAANPVFVQDVHIGYEWVPGTALEGGFLYMPFTHLALNSSSSTNSLEKGTAILFYNNARGLRELGVHFRGLFLDNKIFLRGGLFNGLHGLQGSDPTGQVLNPGGRPLVAGTVRYNFIGYEAGYSFPALYYDGKSRVSVGLSAQYQLKGSNTPITTVNAAGVRATANTAVNDYVAYAADFFADFALPDDQEFAVQTDINRFDWGSGSDKTGWGSATEVGYRIGPIEPQVNGYWFNSESKQANFFKIAGGLNYFFIKHQSRIGIEFWHIKQNVPWDGSSYLHQILVQYQASF